MKVCSPLRYPGGKFKIASLLSTIRNVNDKVNFELVEPYSGGAGASLKLLLLEESPIIHINDADPAIYNFWWSLLNKNKEFIDLLDSVPVTIEEWEKQKFIYTRPSSFSQLEHGFATFFLNRCNRSGIIMNAGPIGGYNQTGKWKINARFNKNGLRKRCKKIGDYRDRIKLYNKDGLEIFDFLKSDNKFFFIDPPYYHKGDTLYLNKLNHNYHQKLSDKLRSLKNTSWVLTYDDCHEIRGMYESWANIQPFSLQYSAANKRKGKEVLITPKYLSLPSSIYEIR